MSIKTLTIKGLRGFSEQASINFALPDKKNPGSGLTVLVGANNSGKSTVIEAIYLLNSNVDSIPYDSRNPKNDRNVQLSVEYMDSTYTLETTDNGGSFVKRICNGKVDPNNVFYNNILKTFILSSKRGFSSTFNNNNRQTRENYKGNINNSEYRSDNYQNNNFGGRLLNVYDNRQKFEECLKKVLNPIPNWTIETTNYNSSYLKFSLNGVEHGSKEAGDGYINIFNIIDALYDSSEDNTIIIDEPEISLHPDLQRKLFDLLVEYSKDKQIIISTHSPYFVDWNIFAENGKVVRLNKIKDSIKTYELTDATKLRLNGIINDSNNPHILSLNANEVFFLNDNVILTEGQDDVLCYKKIFKEYNFQTAASFFGWGAGGATKIDAILNLLNDLGYKKVFIVLDNDKREMIDSLKEKFPHYCYFAIEANDVRDKKEQKKIKDLREMVNNSDIDEIEKNKIVSYINKAFKETEGLVSNVQTCEVKEKFKDNVMKLLAEIQEYFSEIIDIESSSTNKDIKLEKDRCASNEFIEEKAVEGLIEKYFDNHSMNDYIESKYKKLQFSAGDGGQISLKKINKNKYYVIAEHTAFVSERHSATVEFHLIVNTKEMTVKVKKKKIVSNTLPVNKLMKMKGKLLY